MGGSVNAVVPRGAWAIRQSSRKMTFCGRKSR